MGLYIQSDKNKVVRHYYTSPQIEKAIETLLQADGDLVFSETHTGYEIEYKKIEPYKVEGNEHNKR